MRPHGRATANRRKPRAWGVCDQCGFLYNRFELQWQYQWAGNRLVNQNMLVCDRCYDVPQEQLRVIVLPADPTPIVNPRPERYAIDNNPVTPLGSNIGTLTQGAGLVASFDSNSNKPMFLSSCLFVSTAGLTNSVGKYWGNDLTVNDAGFTASRFVAYAPNDAKFCGSGAVAYEFQGSQLGVGWTTLYSGTTAGTIGETIDVSITPTTAYLYHQFVVTGDGINSAAVAQLKIYSAG